MTVKVLYWQRQNGVIVQGVADVPTAFAKPSWRECSAVIPGFIGGWVL